MTGKLEFIDGEPYIQDGAKTTPINLENIAELTIGNVSKTLDLDKKDSKKLIQVVSLQIVQKLLDDKTENEVFENFLDIVDKLKAKDLDEVYSVLSELDKGEQTDYRDIYDFYENLKIVFGRK